MNYVEGAKVKARRDREEEKERMEKKIKSQNGNCTEG